MKKETITNWVVESPRLIDSTDFRLNDVDYNRKLAKKLSGKKKEVIEDTVLYEIFRTDDDINGYIVHINKEVKSAPNKEINYLVKYHSRPYKKFGSAVTQVAIWKRAAGPGIPGITSRIFWGYLFKRWSTIISDREQTERGKDFWETRLQEAVDRGYTVGLSSTTMKEVEWYSGDTAGLVQWFKDFEAWGKTKNHLHKRFIITRVGLPDIT